MKMRAGAEAGRRRGARRRNQAPSDSNSICRLHRRMIVCLGAGWRESWPMGSQNQQRRLQCYFLMPSTKPKPRTRERGHTPRTYDDDGAPAAQGGGGRGGRGRTVHTRLVDHGGGGVREEGAGTVDPFDPVDIPPSRPSVLSLPFHRP